MLQNIKIKNFRSIKEKEISFSKTHTNISWNNWAWKTNILQAILFVFWNNIQKLKTNDLIKIGEKNMYIECDFLKDWLQQKVSFWFSNNKKSYFLNWKKKSKNIIKNETQKLCFFGPTDMNLFYLWPKYKRDFLNNILWNTFLEYNKIYKEYEIVLKNRNKTLKNIFLEKSKENEINIWDEKFITLREKIYNYIFNIISFFQNNIDSIWDIFIKNNKYNFIYKTKVKKESIKEDIRKYLKENIKRDIILQKTHIWPHIDDFDIEINWNSILNFASRWELKSVILELKKIELEYIQKITAIHPILLIDDIKSELDEKHINLICNKFKNYQVISTSIIPLQKEEVVNIYI